MPRAAFPPARVSFMCVGRNEPGSVAVLRSSVPLCSRKWQSRPRAELALLADYLLRGYPSLEEGALCEGGIHSANAARGGLTFASNSGTARRSQHGSLDAARCWRCPSRRPTRRRWTGPRLSA
eukprot:scaffold109285_cov45-Phaeocystis_antarctica.AAC.1